MDYEYTFFEFKKDLDKKFIGEFTLNSFRAFSNGLIGVVTDLVWSEKDEKRVQYSLDIKISKSEFDTLIKDSPDIYISTMIEECRREFKKIQHSLK